ncbi:Uma2 family endonuclease [Streptomyces millisiae]|uniref:Uma2 family endonuclease n=1 Tax=Streptomyces millisiae TaxID=3075542 RepID=A0ABU2LUG2_9ACTN|nr:Uma2 family endonuclease [Streptomyces sp. DSM 44918]MDT0320913.1 Uma2 family endonuclease [Streptomyces sp. DSM 44918]
MALPIDPDIQDGPVSEEKDPEEAVLEVAANLDVPEGYRVQVIDGRIIVTPPADGDHAVALTALMAALLAAGAEEKGLHVVQGLGIYLRPGKKGFAIPDLALVDEDFREHQLPYNCYAPSVFRLVAEVTSSNWRDDTDSKVTAYATVGVPVYLIADREHGKVLVLTRPHEGAYQSTAEYLPGDKVEIPGDLPCQVAVEKLLQIR